MSLKNLLFVTLLFATNAFVIAQRNFNEYNHIGIYGGVTQMDLQTNNFVTEQGTGFAAGFVTRGDVYNNFDMEYGITFMQNQVGILGRNPNTLQEQFIDYTLPSTQIRLLGGYNIIRHHLSIDAGPILNVNGRLKPQSGLEEYILDGYTNLRASDLENVSRIHFHVAAGITAGLENFKLNVQYQYGVTNLFSRFQDSEALQNEAPDGGFKANTSTLIFGAYILF